jgi:hypothetical protein
MIIKAILHRILHRTVQITTSTTSNSALIMAKRKSKKRARDDGDDEYMTANVQFKNPFHTIVNCSMTSASADDPRATTEYTPHTISYNPPLIPVATEVPKPQSPEPSLPSVNSDEAQKTQVSMHLCIFNIFGFSENFVSRASFLTDSNNICTKLNKPFLQQNLMQPLDLPAIAERRATIECVAARIVFSPR